MGRIKSLTKSHWYDLGAVARAKAEKFLKEGGTFDQAFDIVHNNQKRLILKIPQVRQYPRKLKKRVYKQISILSAFDLLFMTALEQIGNSAK